MCVEDINANKIAHEHIKNTEKTRRRILLSMFFMNFAKPDRGWVMEEEEEVGKGNEEK